MKLLESVINGKKLEINRNLFGKEKVFVDGKIVSKKQNLFGSNHNIRIDGKEYELKYTVKDAWKRLTGKPMIRINSNGALVTEQQIQNRSYFTIQFILSLIVMYSAYLILNMIIESAKNGFVHHAY